MFFEELSDIKKIAERAETVIFAINPPDLTEVGIKPFYILEPDDRDKITIEATRGLLEACNLKQAKDTYAVINHPEKMLDYVQNTLLKLLEEPREHYHYLIFTPVAQNLLPTILSRAEVYYPLRKEFLTAPVAVDDDIKTLARQFLTAREGDLLALSEAVAKHKKNTREYALATLAAAVEIGYKSYFATGNVRFLKRLPKLMECYANIKQNGHIKLHIIADL